MGRLYMKWMLVLRTSNKGFTILEMMVGIAMTLTVSALALAALSNAERGFSQDKNKIEGGQKLSSVIDIVGREIVQAGEQINDPRFPVIKVTPDGVRGSRLIVYRGLEESLSLCSATATTDALTSGIATTTLSLTSTIPAVQFLNSSCIVTPTNLEVTPATNPTTYVEVTPATIPPTYVRTYPTNVQAWRRRRMANGGKLPFFLHDGRGRIQLANLIGETPVTPAVPTPNFDTIGLTIEGPVALSSFIPNVNYPNRSTLNLVEKREYLICGDELKVRVNNSLEGSCDKDDLVTLGSADTLASPFKVVATNITSMNITLTTAVTPTSAPVNNLNINFPCAPAIPAGPQPLCPVPANTLDWRQLRGVTVAIMAPNPDVNAVSATSIVASGRYYPRNILSTNAQ
jgi:type II secretory pathway pseudopilin PulG